MTMNQLNRAKRSSRNQQNSKCIWKRHRNFCPLSPCQLIHSLGVYLLYPCSQLQWSILLLLLCRVASLWGWSVAGLAAIGGAGAAAAVSGVALAKLIQNGWLGDASHGPMAS